MHNESEFKTSSYSQSIIVSRSGYRTTASSDYGSCCCPFIYSYACHVSHLFPGPKVGKELHSSRLVFVYWISVSFSQVSKNVLSIYHHILTYAQICINLQYSVGQQLHYK